MVIRPVNNIDKGPTHNSERAEMARSKPFQAYFHRFKDLSSHYQNDPELLQTIYSIFEALAHPESHKNVKLGNSTIKIKSLDDEDFRLLATVANTVLKMEDLPQPSAQKLAEDMKLGVQNLNHKRRHYFDEVKVLAESQAKVDSDTSIVKGHLDRLMKLERVNVNKSIKLNKQIRRRNTFTLIASIASVATVFIGGIAAIIGGITAPLGAIAIVMGIAAVLFSMIKIHGATTASPFEAMKARFAKKPLAKLELVTQRLTSIRALKKRVSDPAFAAYAHDRLKKRDETSLLALLNEYERTKLR